MFSIMSSSQTSKIRPERDLNDCSIRKVLFLTMRKSEKPSSTQILDPGLGDRMIMSILC